MVAIILLTIVIAVLNAITPFFLKYQIDYLSGAVEPLADVPQSMYFFLLLVIPAALELLRIFVFSRIQYWFEQRFRHSLRMSLQEIIWERMKLLDGAFFKNPQNQPIVEAAQRSSYGVVEYFFFFLDQVRSITTMLAIFPLLLFVSWKLLVAILLASAVMIVISEWSRQERLRSNVENLHMTDEARRSYIALRQDFSNLRQYSALEKLIDEFKYFEDKSFSVRVEQENRRRFFDNLSWLGEQILTVGTSLWVGLQVFSGSMTLGTFTLTLSYVRQLHSLFLGMIQSVGQWLELNTDFTAVQFFFSLQSRLQSGTLGRKTLQNPITLELKNVQFTYPELWKDGQEFRKFRIQQLEQIVKRTGARWYRHEIEEWKAGLQEQGKNDPVLHNISLSLQTGEITTLLGRNGAGKTTITQLLLHEYEPNSGEVLLNGVDLYQYNQEFLLQQYSLLQQKPFILPEFSIRENVVLGSDKKISDSEIWKILEEIDAANFVRKLPKQLDAVIGRDTNFSGGQEQLLALGRCFLSPRPVIIFDEASSQLDVEHELKILQALQRRKKQSAILFITHRVSVARKADRIVMIDDGRIVQTGTHADLVKTPGLYQQFWQTQVEG